MDARYYSITADEAGAYAILMQAHSEQPGPREAKISEEQAMTDKIDRWCHSINSVERQTTRFVAPLGDPGIAKLRKEILTGNGIRVLRMANLKSPLAPRVGLRYDGL